LTWWTFFLQSGPYHRVEDLHHPTSGDSAIRSSLFALGFVTMLIGTLIAAVRTEVVEERPLAEAEMAVLHGGGETPGTCCYDTGLCDAIFPQTPCDQRPQGEDCGGQDVPFGHNLSCSYPGGSGVNCFDTADELCLVFKKCYLDNESHLCMASPGQTNYMNNGDCVDTCGP